MRRLLVAAVSLVAVALTAPPALAAPAPPLDHEGRWFTDARGRAVMLHGFNMVYKVGSYRPEDIGFGVDDARFLSRHGYNTIRLGIIYKGLEPRPPVDGDPRYRRAYLDSIARTERVLDRHGIYSLLDFHQDLYNERFQGEGWPDWQTLDDGLPAEPKVGFPGNYLAMPALNRAFDHFWANESVAGVGLQDAWARAWRKVAERFRTNPYVMGYDILNEPWPGSVYPTCTNPIGCPVFDSTTLTDFSTLVMDRIRQVDPRTLVFYEPLLTFDFGAQTAHGDTGDPDAGFSFHNYCLPGSLLTAVGAIEGPVSATSCRDLEDLVFENAESVSARTGDVPFLTEFGATDNLATNRRLVELADEHMVSWQSWHYCDCDDPTTSGPGVQSVVIDPREPPRGDNVKRQKLKVLTRPYPQAVNGTPQAFSFDPDTRRFELDYSTAAPGARVARRVRTQVFIPKLHYRDGYSVKVDGARVVSAPDARTLALVNRRGADRVSLSVTPGNSSGMALSSRIAGESHHEPQ